MRSLGEVAGRDVSRETCHRAEAFLTLLLAENQRQNLISRASEAEAWQRHILDSAQLLRFVPPQSSWIDVGTGPGLPGIVLALVDQGPKILVEPRRRRVDFLQETIISLGLGNVTLIAGRAETATAEADVITARAVASPETLFAITGHLRHDQTVYVLPRGTGAHSELEAIRNSWQGEFGLHSSLTSDQGSILVARHVRRKGSR